jgi:hypothetical protein
MSAPKSFMYFERPQQLHTNVQVKAINRPIKIAYLVPHEETASNHWVIDAVFYESYTRWSGARTLIIPTDSHQFLHPGYANWLAFYDPDFIYTYIDLEQKMIEEIDRACCPIAFISHKHKKTSLETTRWQDYLPDWIMYFSAVSSRTTIHSPYAGYRRPLGGEKEPKSILITQQFIEVSEERFVTDNFGIAFDLHMVTHPVKGLFDTHCLVPNNLGANIDVGTTKTTSITDILSQVGNSKAITVAKLAMAHTKSIPRAEPYEWASKFNLFIGKTCIDRIHFWNARHFSPDYIDVPGALIVTKEQLGDTEFINQLGQFLNNHNFLRQSNSPAQVGVRSYSHSKEELSSICESLKKYTFNHVFLTNAYNDPAVLTTKDINKHYYGSSDDVTTFKLNENINKLQAKEPEHFAFTPARFRGFNEGQWIVELEIERHNNLSRFSNVVDTWMLPRRNRAVKAFTDKLAKITKDHRLAIVPSTDAYPFRDTSISKAYLYNLHLPDDETFFRSLINGTAKYPIVDLRSSLNYDSYYNIELSDKGQNLRGVISMFANLYEAFNCLTNKYWRAVLKIRKREGEPSKNNIYTLNKLESLLPNDRQAEEELRKRLNFKNIGTVKKYLKANLRDALEFLINKKVFYQVYQWRCSYCGHTNTLTFDYMKNTNNCEICNEEHCAAIDLEWKYKLNAFVDRSLYEHNGLTVLWALGYLQDRYARNSFYYLPEVDLFPEYDNLHNKNEIDTLCVLKGKFCAVEVKLSAISFIEKSGEIKKFTEKIKLIQPDVALLVFEQYCESETDLEATKQALKKVVEEISQSVGQHIKIKTMVASDFLEFNEFPAELGPWGRRVLEMLEKMKK